MAVFTEKQIEIPRIFVLRGSPGVGKSTISKSINKINSSKKKTYISVDTMQHMDLRTPCRNKEVLGMKNAALLAASFLTEGFDVVFDYVFENVDDLNMVVNYLKENCKDFFLQIFYLDAPLECVQKRNQSRAGKRGEYMNTALLKKLYSKVSETKGNITGEMVINTHGLSAKQTARTIVSNAKGLLNGIELMEMILLPEDAARALETEDGE